MTDRPASVPAPRMWALVGVLVVSLFLAGALAWQAISTTRMHRATAERTLTDYAEFAAFLLGSRAYREIGAEVLTVFTDLPSWRSEAVFTGTRAPAGTGCAGAGIYFEFEPADGTARVVGATIDPAHWRSLLDTLTHARELLDEADWKFRLISLDLGTAGDGVFIRSEPLAGGFGVRGFSTCLGGDSSAFRRIMQNQRALPPALTGDQPADSLYLLEAGYSGAPPIYRSPVTYDSPFTGSESLWSEFGDMEVRVTLREDIADDLVIGGIPGSRLPLTLGLLGLSALLVLGAIFQLRREFDLMNMRSRFVSNVSHELRTPLSQILLFTELLKLRKLRSEEERSRSLEIIDQETRRLIRLVENVLQFSRAGGATSLNLEVLDLERFLGDTAAAFRPLADAQDVKLEQEIEPDARTVRADRNALRQVLLNLLDNAVKYGPRGQTVRVTSARVDGRIELAVEDQGPGVPRSDRDRVWEGFQRLDRETDSAVAGSGIGLSVVRSLVSRMGGAARIEDADAGGARFVVSLSPPGDEE